MNWTTPKPTNGLSQNGWCAVIEYTILLFAAICDMRIRLVVAYAHVSIFDIRISKLKRTLTTIEQKDEQIFREMNKWNWMADTRSEIQWPILGEWWISRRKNVVVSLFVARIWLRLWSSISILYLMVHDGYSINNTNANIETNRLIKSH